MALRMPSVPVTADDLEHFPEDGNRYEVIDGVVLVTPPPPRGHQRLVFLLAKKLDVFAVGHGLEVMIAPVDVRASPVTQVEPDVLVLPRHFAGRELVRWEPMAALVLAVEILSPSTAHVDRGRKRELYLEQGVPEYWIIDEALRSVELWRPGASEPQRIIDTLRWTPPDVTDSLYIDLFSLFSEAS